jgi:serine/threonine-protein kinase
MDLLDGAPLDRYLNEHHVLAPEVALPVLRPIADALDALHGAGIIHRDVKPGNIFLAWESSGEVVPKLLDFGLVKLLQDSPIHTASGVPMGTPFYMSPEQCRGDKVDARADVYAFGVICYELLTGSPPFMGDSPSVVLVAHIMSPPPPPSTRAPALPVELDAPMLAMLAKDPQARPASVGEAFRALEQAAVRAGIHVPAGLPRLPRPTLPPDIDSDVGGRSTARPAGARAEDDGTSGGLRASRARHLAAPWLAVGLLVLAGALAVSLLKGRSTPEEGEQAPSATPSVAAAAAPAPVVSVVPSATEAPLGEPSSALSASAAPSASAPVAPPRPKPKRKTAPEDLEDPF